MDNKTSFAMKRVKTNGSNSYGSAMAGGTWITG